MAYLCNLTEKQLEEAAFLLAEEDGANTADPHFQYTKALFNYRQEVRRFLQIMQCIATVVEKDNK